MWLRHVYVTFSKHQNLNQESCDCLRKSQMLTHIPLLLIEVIDVTWLFANWGEELSARLIFPLWPLQVLFIQSTHCFSNPFREVWKIEIQRECLPIFLQWLVWSRRCHMSASKSRPRFLHVGLCKDCTCTVHGRLYPNIIMWTVHSKGRVRIIRMEI